MFGLCGTELISASQREEGHGCMVHSAADSLTLCFDILGPIVKYSLWWSHSLKGWLFP